MAKFPRDAPKLKVAGCWEVLGLMFAWPQKDPLSQGP